MKCLSCKRDFAQITNDHLVECCGLTLQEYALRYGLTLDVLISEEWLNRRENVAEYPSRKTVSKSARLILAALNAVGVLQKQDDFAIIPGEVRKLDQLLWFADHLRGYGFQFRQEYIFNDATHRVVAINRLKAKRTNIPADLSLDYAALNTADLLQLVSIWAAVSANFYGNYVFLELHESDADAFCARFTETFRVHFKRLDAERPGFCLLRTRTAGDADALLKLIKARAAEIPNITERYYQPQPTALVAKELVFDSAHFITDHPDKCANLHGGRYTLLVKVYDRIDPITGFVVDYAYLKSVVKRQVIEHLDHKNLNLADAALSWRSSTELINMYIWRQIIDYLPNLYELQTYETTQSYCSFCGPALDEMEQSDDALPMSYFQSAELGHSELRRRLLGNAMPSLTVVGGE